MKDYKYFLDIIEKELEEIRYPEKPFELYQPISYVLAMGGKRIRPVLLLMACNMFSDDISKAIKTALAIEVFHNFTLLHDDVMDHAVLRRNKPTVHVKWDTNVAILSGDAMLIKAYQLLSTLDSKMFPPIYREFNKVALEVCEGQQFDMNFEKKLDVTVDDYINMIRLKTSALIASSLKMGAILGNADAKNQQSIYDFGLNLGIGFQLQDDMLDTYGNTEVFGKKIGGDIVANKKTYLLLQALAEAEGDRLKALQKLVTSYEVSREEKIEQVLDIFNQLKIKEKTEEKISHYFQVALQCLDDITVADSRKQAIKQVVNNLMNRYV